MKTKMWKMLIATIVILPMTLVSCHDDFMIGISGQGEIVEQTINPGHFDGFVSGIPADIYLTQGSEQKVVIRAQQNIIDNIETDRFDSGTWTIHYRELVRYSKPVKIFITVPTLNKAGVSGSGNIVGMTPFTNLDKLNLIVSGSGSIDLNSVSNQADVIVSGSGTITLEGGTDQVNMVISGSGSFHGTNFITRRAEVFVSGSGDARLGVDEYLRATVSGSGDVYYYGNPELVRHISGSGSIVRIR
jgi:hypothetical protein